VFMSVIYLLILFAPAIVAGEYVPKIGFIFGMSMMLFILAITSSSLGFFPFAIIGFLNIGVMIYKGGLA